MCAPKRAGTALRRRSSARAADAGCAFLRAGADEEEVASLYARVAMNWPATTCYVSASAFRAFAALAGQSPREIVRRLPDAALNRVGP